MGLVRAVEKGAIALLVQIVTSRQPCQVIAPNTLRTLAEICEEIHLPLVIDETVTAIRCGAPFAHQREEYSHFLRPDLIIFGKALKVSGIAVNFEGAILRGLNISAGMGRLRAIFRWHDLQTRAIRIPNLIEALYVIDTAETENWSGRSRKIGRAIRGVIREHEKAANVPVPKPIAGLEALICIEKNRVDGLLLQGVPAGEYIRLLPVLDDALESEEFLENYVVGKGSRKTRRLASEVLKRENQKPLWCYVCGDATEEILGDEVVWCEFCCLSACGEESCKELYGAHHCIGDMD